MNIYYVVFQCLAKHCSNSTNCIYTASPQHYTKNKHYLPSLWTKYIKIINSEGTFSHSPIGIASLVFIIEGPFPGPLFQIPTRHILQVTQIMMGGNNASEKHFGFVKYEDTLKTRHPDLYSQALLLVTFSMCSANVHYRHLRRQCQMWTSWSQRPMEWAICSLVPKRD